MKDFNIAIIGLGYVGLPLSVAFGNKINTIGFDINNIRVQELIKKNDKTLEVSSQELSNSHLLSFTSDIEDIKECNIFIITVPTPIDSQKNPDLRPLKIATEMIGKILKKNDIVIYESTVYPGATEEICIPILEKQSNLSFNKDFYCGYSPERINPGDKEHTLSSIVKITSGSTPRIASLVDELYQNIIIAGTHKVDSIKIAEAAKVIENTQRDVNIALINELSLIFEKLKIDTEAVLNAAGTKWNFLNFKPGLVGGHCIGVDPYYLTYKANEVGYKPEIILAGRKINDNMSFTVARRVSSLMKDKNILIKNSNILIMGLTFKENCPDLRNTKVTDLVKHFKDLKCNVEVYDPWVDNNLDSNIRIISEPINNNYDAIVLAVAHDIFKELSISQIKSYGKENHVIFDLKYLFGEEETDGRL